MWEAGSIVGVRPGPRLTLAHPKVDISLPWLPVYWGPFFPPFLPAFVHSFAVGQFCVTLLTRFSVPSLSFITFRLIFYFSPALMRSEFCFCFGSWLGLCEVHLSFHWLVLPSTLCCPPVCPGQDREGRVQVRCSLGASMSGLGKVHCSLQPSPWHTWVSGASSSMPRGLGDFEYILSLCEPCL